MTKLKLIPTIAFLSILLQLSAVKPCHPSKCDVDSQPSPSRASWMIGNWGIRFVIPAGDNQDVRNWEVSKITSQLKKIKTSKWIMLNLTMPSWGGYFSGPNPTLDSIAPEMAPQRDLFAEMANVLKDDGYRIIAYFAAQGPAADFISPAHRKNLLTQRKYAFLNSTEHIADRWQRYLEEQRLSNDQAVARDIIQYYSKRYGKLIDGWWFDHGKWGDNKLFTTAARTGNQAAAVAWNERHDNIKFRSGGANSNAVWLLTKSAPGADYTDGHVTPTKRQSPWWKGNELIVKQIENCPEIDGALAHFFLPMQSNWRGGSRYFPLAQSIDWTSRVVLAKGALTWACALSPPEFKKSTLPAHQYEQLLKIDQAIMQINSALCRRQRAQ